MQLSPSLVKNALSGHSWIGLVVGAMMYAICISGALLVFHSEFERWEQPNVPEVSSIDLVGMEETLNTYLASESEVTPHMYLVLPTANSPRARLSTENASWFLNAEGALGPKEHIPWSEMLLKLHLYLLLPQSWGMLLVSATGVMLVALIFSGLLAHPKLFRDAFNLRLGGSKQLEQTDAHNRLSVWGAPFYLMIAVTGAYFGLALPNLALYAEAEFDGDREKVVSMVFGDEPALDEPLARIATTRAIEQIGELAPDAEPFMLVLHDAGETKQHMSISALHPNRLIYSENYLFAADGRYLRSDGFLDGSIGKQAVYSIYRAHFGHFGGQLVQWAYLVLGLGLAAVSATGVNIWLARRRKQDVLEDLWVGVVWGLPLAIVLSAIVLVVADVSPGLALLVGLALALGVSTLLRNPARSRNLLRLALCIAAIALVTLHLAFYGDSAIDGAAGVINFVLIVTASAGLVALYKLSRRAMSALQQ